MEEESSEQAAENEQVLMETHKSPTRSKEIYGSPRITEDLRAKGIGAVRTVWPGS